MKRSEKIAVPLMIAILALGVLVVLPSLVSATTVEISNASASPGATTTTTIVAHDVENLGNFGITVSFDHTVVNVTDVTKGPDVGTFAWEPVTSDSVRMFTVNTLEIPSLSGDVLLATLTLKAVGTEGDTSPLNLEIGKLLDNVSNPISATPVNGTFAVTSPDTTPPDTTIVSGPTGTITYNDVTFTWSGSDDVTPTAQLEYSYILEGYDTSWSAWTSATSKSYTDLPNGAYTFKVKAKDLALNEDPTPASSSFTVSVTAYAPGVGGRVADSDGDGWSDSYEIRMGTDPNDPNSYPGAPAPTPSPTPTATPTPTPTATPTTTPKPPGFEAVFAIAGLLAVAYLVLRRKK